MRQLIRRKVLVSMLFVGLSLLGVISYRALPVELLPAMEMPVLFIQLMAPVERDLKFVEQEAIVPLEGAAARLDKVEKIESRVTTNGGMVSVYFAQQADMRYSYLKLSEEEMRSETDCLKASWQRWFVLIWNRSTQNLCNSGFAEKGEPTESEPCWSRRSTTACWRWMALHRYRFLGGDKKPSRWNFSQKYSKVTDLP